MTLPSELNRGRHTYGFFRKMRFEATVADSAARYVELAVRIATDTGFRTRLKDDQAHCTAALYEDDSAVEQIGRVFETALNAPRTYDRSPN